MRLAEAVVSKTSSIDNTLREKLWLEIARKTVQQNNGIKPAWMFLKRSELFRIEETS
jgi:hypothetical protein